MAGTPAAEQRRSAGRRGRGRPCGRALNDAELRPTALVRSSGPTISLTNDWRAGASKADADAEDEAPARRRARSARRRSRRAAPSSSAVHGHARLGDLQQPPLGEAVGDQAGVRREQQDRQELQAGGDAERGAAVVRSSCRTSQSWATRCIQVPTLETTPPRGVQAVVAVRQGAERGAQATVASLFEESGAPRRSRARSSGVSSRSRWASQASRRRRSCEQVVPPCSVRSTTTWRPSVSCGAADDVAAVDQAVDGAGHRRRLHPLERGELTDGALARRGRASPSTRQLPDAERRCPASRSLRSRRGSRMTETRSALASLASARCCLVVGLGIRLA